MKTPWYKDGLRFACTQCGDCCSGAPGYVWVDEPEIVALAEAMQMELETFRDRFIRRVGSRFSLIEYSDGDCILLDPETRKCLAYEGRPIQCRTWPFWNSNLRSESDWESTCEVCPGAGKGKLYALGLLKNRGKRKTSNSNSKGLTDVSLCIEGGYVAPAHQENRNRNAGTLRVLIVVLMVLPTLIGTKAIYQPLVNRLAADDFVVKLDGVRLRWLTPLQFRGIEVEQRDGTTLLSIAEINTDRGLLGYLLSGRKMGRIEIVRPLVDVRLIEDTTNLARFVKAIEGKQSTSSDNPLVS